MTDINVVFEAIRDERNYQRCRWGNRQEDGAMKEDNHSVGDFLVYMHRYMTESIEAATKNPGDEKALASMLKVVTLGVACFEQHGVVSRKIGNQGIVNARDEKVI